LNFDVSAGKEVDLDDPADMYYGALFYPKGRPLPEEYRRYAGCGGTLMLWTIAR